MHAFLWHLKYIYHLGDNKDSLNNYLHIYIIIAKNKLKFQNKFDQTSFCKIKDPKQIIFIVVLGLGNGCYVFIFYNSKKISFLYQSLC